MGKERKQADVSSFEKKPGVGDCLASSTACCTDAMEKPSSTTWSLKFRAKSKQTLAFLPGRTTA